ncbi:MAG: S8 family serine peptidase [Anaerolineae bacterium]|nr:S8 family serine peptidase [Anaerolineae bacterium]
MEWNIARVRADRVWTALGIDGNGVVVANIDSGVDGQHPALARRYRGYNPKGLPQHTGNWIDTTNEGYLYPGDAHGHGTHTMGTMVGENGIGVAPGAQWIAVRAFDIQGRALDSWIHAAFQWIIAPAGDPALAPDVVNNSWGTDSGAMLNFWDDLEAVRAAGILPVVSAGNTGPQRGTVSAPASYPAALAVGALDDTDTVAAFSSRGPSPFGEVKPEVVAPGAGVRSSFPGGTYALNTGTSMAAPHVAGLVALLHQADPTLGVDQIERIITGTARALGAFPPDNDAGWGLVDAYAAVALAQHAGELAGTVQRAPDGASLNLATVTVRTHDGAPVAQGVADATGHFTFALAAGVYDVSASRFGYGPQTIYGVVVSEGGVARHDFILEALPVGVVTGRVTELESGATLSATVEAVGLPASVQADGSTGLYSLALPAGEYLLRARVEQHRVVTATVMVTSGLVTPYDFALPRAPRLLLVDSGAWYYDSQAHYFRRALDDLGYLYDVRTIRTGSDGRLTGVPTAAELAPYGIVIWSSPADSPGYVGAHTALETYLTNGGRLFLTGQDVGYWESGRGGLPVRAYYRDLLKARFAADQAQSTRVVGNGLFAGLDLTLGGGDGANNQTYPDVVASADAEHAFPALAYTGEGTAALQVGSCLAQRVVYLGFGWEGLASAEARREILGRALAWLASPPEDRGLHLTAEQPVQVGSQGSVLTFTLRLRHTTEGVNEAERINLDLSPAAWGAHLTPTEINLAPCSAVPVTVTLAVPLDVGWDARQPFSVTARSALSPARQAAISFIAKAPAPILLVDDDRWYDQEAKYEAALAAGGFAYDRWEVGWEDGKGIGSPPTATLRLYPLVIWFTAYDWHQPLTQADERRLAAYLDGGGRLFLTGQDILYYRGLTPFLQNCIGVAAYQEIITATAAAGVPASPVGDSLGPYPLDYPFLNWSDGLTPGPGAAAAFTDPRGWPIALTTVTGTSRSLFFSFPLESLRPPNAALVMERAVGWLSWLGNSTLTVDRARAVGGDRLTYTARLLNDGPQSLATVRFAAPLPSGLDYAVGSLAGGGEYEAENRRIVWEGPLASGAGITLTYQADVTGPLPPGSRVLHEAELAAPELGLRFHRAASTRVDAPDLAASALAVNRTEARPGDRLTYTLTLRNDAPSPAPAARAVAALPLRTSLVPTSLAASDGTVGVHEDEIVWTGSLVSGLPVTVTYSVLIASVPEPLAVAHAVWIDDGYGETIQRKTLTLVTPYRAWFPLLYRRGEALPPTRTPTPTGGTPPIATRTPTVTSTPRPAATHTPRP